MIHLLNSSFVTVYKIIYGLPIIMFDGKIVEQPIVIVDKDGLVLNFSEQGPAELVVTTHKGFSKTDML